MSRRWSIWIGVSTLLGLLLAWALVHGSGIELGGVAVRLAATPPLALLVLTGLVGLNTWLSAVRWRRIALKTGMSETPSRRTAFALTALGIGAGQFLPVQVAATLSRSLGGRLLGDRRPVRTVIATVYEQSFDFGLMVVLAAASSVALAAGSTLLWAPAAAVAFFTCLFGVRAAPWLLRLAPSKGRIGGWIEAVRRSGALDEPILRALVLLSGLRFLVLWGMAMATSWCAGLDPPPLALAAALPLVAIVTALPITPAGFGVNEWTFAAVMAAFGVSLQTAAEWALVNRVVVTVASLTVSAVGVAVAVQERFDRRPSEN